MASISQEQFPRARSPSLFPGCVTVRMSQRMPSVVAQQKVVRQLMHVNGVQADELTLDEVGDGCRDADGVLVYLRLRLVGVLGSGSASVLAYILVLVWCYGGVAPGLCG